MEKRGFKSENEEKRGENNEKKREKKVTLNEIEKNHEDRVDGSK